LRRCGRGRLAARAPKPPTIRHEREKPGKSIHIDIKELGRIDPIGHRITDDRTRQSNRRAAGRGLGWVFSHLAIDHAWRLSCNKLPPIERKKSAVD
jgi:hypothetical protein